ncbi:unnamed protein product [Linum trigynum]|uniref:Uncharacterized protein n=1 Tax=Linum trigynum TaxID=586398 RepID=A0AAV2EBC4_9ROSI
MWYLDCILTVGQAHKFALLGAYRPQEKEEKLAFLRDLKTVCENCFESLCIIRDFNLVRSEEDFRGHDRDRGLMEEFNKLICDAGLVDLPLRGLAFMWIRGVEVILSHALTGL